MLRLSQGSKKIYFLGGLIYMKNKIIAVLAVCVMQVVFMGYNDILPDMQDHINICSSYVNLEFNI